MTGLPELLRAQPAEREVLRDGARRLTYGALDARSDRVAAALAADGVRPGARVAFHSRNTPELFEVLFGAVKIGAEAVLVNARLTPAEIDGVLADARPDVLVTGGGPPRSRMITLDDGGYERWLAGARGSPEPRRADPGAVAVQLYTSGTTGRPKGALHSRRAHPSGVLRRELRTRVAGTDLG